MTFSRALELLKHGEMLTRTGWNGKGMYLAARFPNQTSEMELPYIYLNTAQNQLVPWVASQTDLFASDWEVVP